MRSRLIGFIGVSWRRCRAALLGCLVFACFGCVTNILPSGDDQRDYRDMLRRVMSNQAPYSAFLQFARTHPKSVYADDAVAVCLSLETVTDPDPTKWETFLREYEGSSIDEITVQTMGELFPAELCLGYKSRLLWEYLGYFLSRSDLSNMSGDVYGKCAVVFATELAERVQPDDRTQPYVRSALKVMLKFYKSKGDAEQILKIEERISRLDAGG